MKEEEYKVANFATLLSKTQKWMNLISHGFWKMKMRSFRLKTNTQGTFPLFVYILVSFFWRFSSFSSSKPARSQPRPPSQQETKKIKSYHKSWMFQDFLSFQVMKYMSCAKWRWGKLGADSSDYNICTSGRLLREHKKQLRRRTPVFLKSWSW